MRINPAKVDNGPVVGRPVGGDGLRYVARWPEQVSISDGQGGKDRDFWLIILQYLGIAAIVGSTGLVLMLSLWALPPAAWWGILTTLYFAAIAAIAIGGYLRLAAQDLPIRAGAGVLAVALLVLSVQLFDKVIWDPLDEWTTGFFTAKLPVPNGWLLAALVLSGATILLFIARRYTQWALMGIPTAATWYAAAITVKWVAPTLHFYIVLAIINIALIYAASLGVKRLSAEIIKPFLGSLESYEDDSEEPIPEKQFTLINDLSMRSPLKPIGKLIRVSGPKGEPWLLSEDNLVAFIKHLPARGVSQSGWKGVKMPAGLIMYNQRGKVEQKNAPITQWEHWGPYYHFLMQTNIYDGKNFNGLFTDAHGDPNPEAILEFLQLNGYAREEEEIEELH